MKNECEHKEILLGEYVVKDEVGGLKYHLCKNCYDKIKHLSGYKLVFVTNATPKSEVQKQKDLKSVPF